MLFQNLASKGGGLQVHVTTLGYISEVVVMMIDRQGFSTVTETFTMVNDCSPAIILSADIIFHQH